MVIKAKELKELLMYAVLEKRQDIRYVYISCKTTKDKYIQLNGIFADVNSAKYLQVMSKTKKYNIPLDEEVVIYVV